MPIDRSPTWIRPLKRHIRTALATTIIFGGSAAIAKDPFFACPRAAAIKNAFVKPAVSSCQNRQCPAGSNQCQVCGMARHVPPPIPPGSFQFSRFVHELTPRRILIFHANNRLDRLREQSVFSEALARQMAIGGKVSVIQSDMTSCNHTSPLITGRYDEQQIAELSRRYNADAILFFDLRDFAAYAPMSMRAQFVLVHAHESVPLASGSVTLDLKDRSLMQRYMQVPQPMGKFGDDIRHHSPRQFIDFSATLIARELRSGLLL